MAFLLGTFPVLSERFVSAQIAGLLERGHDVALFAGARPQPGGPDEPDGFLSRAEYLSKNAPPDSGLTELDGDSADARALRASRPDVLQAHFGPSARRYLYVRELVDAPLVVTFHGWDFSSFPATRPNVYDRLFEVADAVTHNCEHARKRLAALGCPAEKLHLLRMPVDVRALTFEPRRPAGSEPVRLLTVARLVDKKGHDVALRALALLSDHRFRYEIVGDGPERPRLEALTDELGLRASVTFHGARDGGFVRSRLAVAHLFLLASRTAADGDEEGTPLSLVEAQACGLPVVSTRHSGIPEVVLDGESGLLVPEDDVEAFAHALDALLRDPSRWPAMGEAGRRFVERFDVAACARQLEELYVQVVQ